MVFLRYATAWWGSMNADSLNYTTDHQEIAGL